MNSLVSDAFHPGRHARQALRLSELLGALSHALDLTEGQPEGHCIRSCWIGLQVGRAVGLRDDHLWELYYTLLLKDLGCSSNAARICELYLTDDRTFKHGFKSVGDSLPQVLRFVLAHTGLKAGLAERFRAIANILQNGGEIARELIATRCQRGADIARQMRFSEAVAAGIQNLDEHWDGGGKPEGLRGEAIPIYSRIALLAQVVDVFRAGGPADARGEVRRRSGTWFEPRLVECFLAVSASPSFWETLASPDLESMVFALEPGQHATAVDEDYLDDVAAAFAQVVDAKSPYTAGHSTRVALFGDMVAEAMGMPPERRRWLKRASLLHDIGKLAVPNTILDKAGKLDEAEWVVMRQHSAHSEAILARMEAFRDAALVAGGHHERLDGKGYPKGLRAEALAPETRIITTADIFDALTADRPYRAAMPVAAALSILRGDVGSAVDSDCVAALERALARIDGTGVAPVDLPVGKAA